MNIYCWFISRRVYLFTKIVECFKIVFLRMMLFGQCQSDEHGTEHREHVSLDKRYEQLEAVHENHERETYHRERRADERAELAGDEDDAGEGKDNGVPAHDVGKETHHQGERLGEDAEEFDDRHHRHGHFEPSRYGRPEYFFPIFAVAREVHHEHRGYGEEERDVDVARHVRAAGEYGNQPEEVRGKDEEEGGEEIGRKALVMLLADAGLDEVVVDRHHEHLYQSHKAFRRSTVALALAVPACRTDEDDEHQGCGNPDLQHVLGNGEVPRTHRSAVGQEFVNLTIGFFVEIKAFVDAVGRMVEAGGAEHVPAALLAFHDDGQGNGDMMPVPRGDVPFVGIAHVPEHDFLHVYRLIFLLGCRGGRGKGRANEK